VSDGRLWWQVGKNAFLCEALEEYFPAKRDELDSNKLEKLASKVGLHPPFPLFFSLQLPTLYCIQYYTVYSTCVKS
jgi:hypothetical protein